MYDVILSINWFSSELSSTLSLLESKDGKNDPSSEVRKAAAPPPTIIVAAAAVAGSTGDASIIDDNPVEDEEGLFIGFFTFDGGVGSAAALLMIPK